MKSADGCESAPTPVTINPAPSAPAAPTATATQPTCAVATGTITVTAPTGVTYSFDNGATYDASATSIALPAGTYQVKVKSADGCESAPTPVTINPAICGSIGDFVFLDNDNSNTQTAGDTPVPGVKVYLLNSAGVKIDSTTTDGTGKYLFSNLPLGTYSVQFVAPAGQSFVTPLQGGDPAKDSDAGTGGKSAPVTLTAAAPNVTTVDAGLKPVLGSIGDYVFNDVDNSGTQTAGDTPVAGVKVYLLNAAGVKIDSTVTDATGKYLFSNLPLGTYSVQFVAPAGTTFVTPSVGGDPTKDSDAGTGGKSAPVTLTATTPNVTTVDAGLIPIKDPRCVSDVIITSGAKVDGCIGKPYPTLSATVVVGTGGTGTIDWYKKATGGVAVATSTLSYTPAGNVAASDTFYVQGRSTTPNVTCPLIPRTMVIVVAKNCADTVDLHLTKKVDTKIVKLGDVVTYTIKVWNESAKNATGVEVTDQLPVGLQYVSSVASRGSYSDGTGLWTIGNIAAAGDTVTLAIKAKVVAEGVTFNTAEISKVDQKDKVSTPGNGKDGEDDIDRACITVPVKLCLGQGAEATVPSNYTGVIWKDASGAVVPSNGNSVTFTKAGTYTFTATNGSCPAGGCCPVIVEEINCCPTEICVPFTITKKKR